MPSLLPKLEHRDLSQKLAFIHLARCMQYPVHQNSIKSGLVVVPMQSKLPDVLDHFFSAHTLPVTTSAVIVLARPRQANLPVIFCKLAIKPRLIVVCPFCIRKLGHSAAAVSARTMMPRTGSISHRGTPVAEISSCSTAPLPVILSLSSTAYTNSDRCQKSET